MGGSGLLVHSPDGSEAVVGEPAASTPALAFVREQMEAGQLVRRLGQCVAEVAKGAATVDRALEAISELRVVQGVDEVRHVPPAGVRTRLDPQPAFLVLASLVVDGLLKGRLMPNVAGRDVDPSAAMDRIALEDRGELLEVHGERTQVAREPF